MLAQLKKQFPNLNFEPSNRFVYSPKKDTIYYNQQLMDSPIGHLALLHEISHALLGHKTYQLDIELLNMEVEAWSKAKELAGTHKIKISQDHIDGCLETYRIWIFKRSRCPHCNTTSAQESESTYRCFNCNASWQVAQSHSLHPRRMRLQSSLTGST